MSASVDNTDVSAAATVGTLTVPVSVTIGMMNMIFDGEIVMVMLPKKLRYVSTLPGSKNLLQQQNHRPLMDGLKP